MLLYLFDSFGAPRKSLPCVLCDKNHKWLFPCSLSLPCPPRVCHQFSHYSRHPEAKDYSPICIRINHTKEFNLRLCQVKHYTLRINDICQYNITPQKIPTILKSMCELTIKLTFSLARTIFSR